MYLSWMTMQPITSSASPSTRVTSCPSFSPAASSFVTESVMGMGQKTPFAVFMSWQTPLQSAFPMKPVSGLKAPIPIMIRSSLSREVMRTTGRNLAFLRASFNSSPLSSKGLSSPPWGGTSLDISSSPSSTIFPASCQVHLSSHPKSLPA